jgi:hypothetical protein
MKTTTIEAQRCREDRETRNGGDFSASLRLGGEVSPV